jgi:LPXTG-motif cell wall-anchored protein
MAALLVVGLVLGLTPLGSAALAQSEGTVVAEGFNGPMGIYVADDGTIWVIDSGMGGDEEMEMMSPTGEIETASVGDTTQLVKISPDGEQTVVANLPSVLVGGEAIGGARIEVVDGGVYVTNGAWISDGTPESMPAPNTAAVLSIGEDGSVEQLVPTWRIEKRMNPDNTVLESHPYGLRADAEGRLWVADAGGNTLLRVRPGSSTVELVTVFNPIEGVFPNPNRGGEMLADPVPTGLDFDDDGNALVAQLSGAPYVPGSAKVVKVTPMGGKSDYATGLTMLTDLRRGPDGEFYAVQFAVFTDQGPTPDSGAIVRIAEGEGSAPVVTGLSFPTSIDFDADGNAYVTINGVGAPGSGAVLKIDGLTSMEAMAPESTPGPEAEAAAEAEAPAAEGEMADIVGTAAGTEQFSTLVAAIQAAGLTGALESEGPFTVFAPTNEAFEALPEGALEELLADPAGDLTQILLYHVVPGEVMAADVTDGLEAATVQGAPLTFTVDGDKVMVNDANVIATDIAATNGVIHVIDSVLLPPAPDEPTATPEAEEEATPEAEEEAAATPEAEQEATPEAAEEAAATPVAEEEATPEAAEEAAATPAPAEEAGAAAGTKGGAPEGMPDTGAAQTRALPVLGIVGGLLLALVGSAVVWRRREP